MALFGEMVDIAMKEVGNLGLIYLMIATLYCVFLIVLLRKKWKSMIREIHLTESEDPKTVESTVAAVGSVIVRVTPQGGVNGFDQIEVGPDEIGIGFDGCDSVFDVLLELIVSISG
jgi:hypothetical protein